VRRGSASTRATPRCWRSVVCEISARPCPWGCEDVLIWPRRAPVRPGCGRTGLICTRPVGIGLPLPITFMTTVDDEETREARALPSRRPHSWTGPAWSNAIAVRSPLLDSRRPTSGSRRPHPKSRPSTAFRLPLLPALGLLRDLLCRCLGPSLLRHAALLAMSKWRCTVPAWIANTEIRLHQQEKKKQLSPLDVAESGGFRHQLFCLREHQRGALFTTQKNTTRRALFLPKLQKPLVIIGFSPTQSSRTGNRRVFARGAQVNCKLRRQGVRNASVNPVKNFCEKVARMAPTTGILHQSRRTT
jgi:hypothetical protein